MDAPEDAPESESSVLVVGAGMAGALLALVLGRAGITTTVVDPRRTLPPMFRNEKLGREQIALLARLGVLEPFAAACWPPEGHPLAYPPGQRPSLDACGAPHEAWLRAVRAAWPESVRYVADRVVALETSPDLQRLTTASGGQLQGRLVALCTGRGGEALLGLERRMVSEAHSVCLGFSVARDEAAPARIISAPYGSGLGFVSLFPMPGETRVNVFSYRALDDPWTRAMSRDPIGALGALVPEAAAALAGARVVRRCEARGSDLYKVETGARPGVVLVGDAFHAPCPASGTGMLRILNDIELLARGYIPEWLSTPGMGEQKIAGFYADSRKRGLDSASLARSLRGRNMAVGRGPWWAAQRALGRLKRSVAAAEGARRSRPFSRSAIPPETHGGSNRPLARSAVR